MDATPIAGLFAAGEITGHFYDSAPNAVAVLRALVFGRIAGRTAMATMIQTVSHERLHA
jgi:tricarballylate dehydrogenase